MLLVEFVVDDVLGDVLDERRPARHLVRLLRDPLLARHLVDLLPVALCPRRNPTNRINQRHIHRVVDLEGFLLI